MVVMKWQNIVITDMTGCKSSLISVYTICHFKKLPFTHHIYCQCKKDHTVTLDEVRFGFPLFAQA